jgi:prepilin-type N-terminal cleavage/methylation domain-containing protein
VRKAFTLIEILVVLVIVGILATLATSAFQTAKINAEISGLLVDIDLIRKTFELYSIDNNVLPGFSYCPIGVFGTRLGYNLPKDGPTFWYRLECTHDFYNIFVYTSSDDTNLLLETGKQRQPWTGPNPVVENWWCVVEGGHPWGNILFGRLAGRNERGLCYR